MVLWFYCEQSANGETGADPSRGGAGRQSAIFRIVQGMRLSSEPELSWAGLGVSSLEDFSSDSGERSVSTSSSSASSPVVPTNQQQWAGYGRLGRSLLTECVVCARPVCPLDSTRPSV